MNSILRAIRFKLIRKNSLQKYILYAAGEILLIVLGILLAVQIGDWNQAKKDGIERNKLLNALLVEFESNRNQLDTTIYYNKKTMQTCLELRSIMRRKGPLPSLDSLNYLTQQLEWSWTFDPKNGALRSGISSGSINLINNDSLSYYLFDWEDIVIDLDENEKWAVDYQIASRGLLSEYVREADRTMYAYYDVAPSPFESDFEGLFNDPSFDDYLNRRFVLAQDVLFELDDVKEHNESIIALIKAELQSD